MDYSRAAICGSTHITKLFAAIVIMCDITQIMQQAIALQSLS